MTREVYLLLGQSNMIGRASTPLQSYGNAAKISAFYMSSANDPACLTRSWGAGADPLHGAGGGNGIGPGMAFADKMIDLRCDPCLEIGLVPCAWSGSASSQWTPTWRPYGNYYGHALRSANQAREWGDIAGIIVNQGETDAQATGYPISWLQNWGNIIRSLRADLEIPKLPAILTKIVSITASGFPGTAYVQDYADQAALMGMKHLSIVSAADLALIEGLHMTAASAVTLGHRYADAMNGMICSD